MSNETNAAVAVQQAVEDLKEVNHALLDGELDTLESRYELGEMIFSAYYKGVKRGIAAVASTPSPEREWTPTHRHFKGGLYRVLHRDVKDVSTSRWSDEESQRVPFVIYDNAQGEVFARKQYEFDGEWDEHTTEGEMHIVRFAVLQASETKP